jgi:hypothetical protein
MMWFKIVTVILFSIVLSVFWGCERVAEQETVRDDRKVVIRKGPVSPSPSQRLAVRNPKLAMLVFSLELAQNVYEQTDYGKPPQFAIWLENADTGQIRTVCVTYRMGSGDWVGKVECPVALPYWVSRYNVETGTKGPPNFKKPVADVITRATPIQDFNEFSEVEPNSKWYYYLEINVSADYNAAFPYRRPNGAPDLQGNGQPSLVYKGWIEAVDGACDEPKLVGRTEQWVSVDRIIADLNGITSAKELVSMFKVCCIGAK